MLGPSTTVATPATAMSHEAAIRVQQGIGFDASTLDPAMGAISIGAW
jgi:hypothetical protein